VKILVVSCHYPPNFVSGGTLQPQRLAQGLRQRGHDVSVYAGYLGGEAGPGSTWSSVDEIGMPIRWIDVTAWTAWDDPRNYDNPIATADFRTHVASIQPEVVHFHSLQSLGGGLVEAAHDLGVPSVVTMHDFWWWCARQFLVDRTMHPCSLVVSAGVCDCQVDREWLARRNRRLQACLSKADLVLSPSATAARVALANGVHPSRLEVDENGIPNIDVPDQALPPST
jgi:hypothetical protein